MKSTELKKKYIEFFKKHEHKEISNSSIIPENDPSVLFTTAGMHPLVPYLLGEKHPSGNKLTNYQKCLRTGDIEEVGDDCHLTFFEMLGNWSLQNAYFKKETIQMSHDFLTKELNIPQDKISITVFKGDDLAPRDEETYNIWKDLGYNDDHIFYMNRKENWWGSVGNTGPCGPDSEMFFDTGKDKCCRECNPSCSCGKFVEVGNNVFMEYNKKEDGTFEKLQDKNIDVGLGFERILTIVNGLNNVYETDLFSDIINKVEELTGTKMMEEPFAIKVISDHLRASVFLLGDDNLIKPSNMDQGYILRRLIRRSIRFLNQLNTDSSSSIIEIAEVIISQYGEEYKELIRNRDHILEQLKLEDKAFAKTLETGKKQIEVLLENIDDNVLDGKSAFKLYDTYGFPVELTEEIARERNISVDIDGFWNSYRKHQEKSRQGSNQKFKGGLADNSIETTKLHTATHLLHSALKTVLGDGVKQRGANINPERLRFDFSFDRKMTPDEITEVEHLVNQYISRNIPVKCEIMDINKAKDMGAIGLFKDKYNEKVKVYSIEGASVEICGGPHINNTEELGEFHIIKEQSSSAGVRRIKAILK